MNWSSRHDRIFEDSATTSGGQIWNYKDYFIYQLFEKPQGWNSEFKLITLKSITRTFFGTMAAIWDFLW